jgi:hypothetical protein
MLELLCRRPDERLDGAAIMAASGLSRHVDVTLAFARMADAFGRAGLARPWNEAQRGYLVDAATAAMLLSTMETLESWT